MESIRDTIQQYMQAIIDELTYLQIQLESVTQAKSQKTIVLEEIEEFKQRLAEKLA